MKNFNFKAVIKEIKNFFKMIIIVFKCAIADFKDIKQEWKNVKNIFDCFAFNLNENGKTLDSFLEKDKYPFSLLGGAFKWHNTKEGSMFWSVINEKSREFKKKKMRENIKKIFFSYLKEEGVFHEYIYYCSHRTFHVDIYRFYNVKHANNFVSDSFVWANTREGHDFWANIHKNWLGVISILDF